MSSQFQNEPLVSVCIITYNSHDYIEDALESVAMQTYQNIELIVSDDASSDDTVARCNNWFVKQQGRFARTEVITSSANTGVSANCNRAISQCKGTWIKLFGGDDVLLPTCIMDNMNYMKHHPSTDIILSDMKIIVGEDIVDRIDSRKVYFENLSKCEFRRYLIYQNFFPAPSVFVTRRAIEKVGGFDENIPFLEDKPFFLRAVFRGLVLSYMNKPTVCYRKHTQSLSNTINVNPKYLESCKLLNAWVLTNIRRRYPALWFYMRNMEMYRDNPSIKNRILHLLRFINPSFYFHKFIDYKIRFLLHYS